MARKRRRPRIRDKNRMAMRPDPAAAGMPPEAMPPTAPPAGMSAATTPPPVDEEGNVTPEEQAMYEKFIENFHEIVFGKTGRQPGKNGEPPIFDTVMESLTSIEDPIDALAVTSVNVVSFLADSAEQAGKPIPHEMLLHAGAEIVPNLAEFAEALGVKDDYSEKELSLVLERAAGMYAEKLGNEGRLDKNAMKGAADELMAADQAGTIDAMLPGMKQAADELGAEVPPPQPQQQPAQQPQGMGQAMMRPPNG